MRTADLLALSFAALTLAACPPSSSSEGEGEGEGEGGEGEGESGEGEGDVGEGEGDVGEGEGEDAPVGDGFFCPVAERVGFVHVAAAFGTVFVDARLDDAVPVNFGPAAISEGACAHYVGNNCGVCSGDDVCHYDGSCGAAPASVAGASVDVDGEVFTADVVGFFGGEVARRDRYSVTVTLPGEEAFVFEAALPEAFPEPFVVDDLAADGNASGGIEANWTSVGDGAAVSFFLKPNHHAPIGFSQCVLRDDDEGVAASAAIIDPLRLVTGFEGGTVSRAFVTSRRTGLGCVEISVQSDTSIFPQ